VPGVFTFSPAARQAFDIFTRRISVRQQRIPQIGFLRSATQSQPVLPATALPDYISHRIAEVHVSHSRFSIAFSSEPPRRNISADSCRYFHASFRRLPRISALNAFSRGRHAAVAVSSPAPMAWQHASRCRLRQLSDSASAASPDATFQPIVSALHKKRM